MIPAPQPGEHGEMQRDPGYVSGQWRIGRGYSWHGFHPRPWSGRSGDWPGGRTAPLP